MSRTEIKTIAKAEFKDHWGALLLVLALTWVAKCLATLLGFGLGSLIVSGPLCVGIYYVYTRAIYNDEADWKGLFFGFRTQFGNSFGIHILVWFITALAGIVIGIVGSIISFIITKIAAGVSSAGYSYDDYSYYSYGSPYGSYGSSLLMTAGIGFSAILIMGILIAVAGLIIGLIYAEAPILLLKEPDIRPVEALKKSRLMMNGNKGRLFIFMLSFIGWFILCGLTAGVLLVYVAPYYMYAKVMLLNRIYEERHGISMDEDLDLQKLNAMKASVKNRTGAVANAIKEKTVEKEEPVVLKEEPAEIKEEPAEVNVCRFCGAKLPEGASFCGKCGKRQ